uniref:Uncharacterized protein n=1 Tax=Romanomermis culicivorax TaxID=13658 RepID=A0A915J0Y9_ROMCU
MPLFTATKSLATNKMTSDCASPQNVPAFYCSNDVYDGPKTIIKNLAVAKKTPPSAKNFGTPNRKIMDSPLLQPSPTGPISHRKG